MATRERTLIGYIGQEAPPTPELPPLSPNGTRQIYISTFSRFLSYTGDFEGDIVRTISQSATMAFPRWLLQYACSFLLLISCSEALKFDMPAHSAHEHKAWRCIQNFVAKDTLVVVTTTISGHKGDGMTVNMHVRTPKPNCEPG